MIVGCMCSLVLYDTGICIHICIYNIYCIFIVSDKSDGIVDDNCIS